MELRIVGSAVAWLPRADAERGRPVQEAAGSGNGAAGRLAAIDIEVHKAIGLIAYADHMMPEVVVWRVGAIGERGGAGGISHNEAIMLIGGAGIQGELLAAVAVAEGDDARTGILAIGAVDPGLDGEGGAGAVGGGEVQEARYVAGETIGGEAVAKEDAGLRRIGLRGEERVVAGLDRKSTRLNSSHLG